MRFVRPLVKASAQLREKTRPGVLRTDAEFKQTFSQARVTKTSLARYYLRAVELHKEGDANSDLGGTLDETFTFNVEHILPLRESAGWELDEQIAQQFRKRLGNMVLLNPDENVKLGNKSFAEKRRAYGACDSLCRGWDLVEWGKIGP